MSTPNLSRSIATLRKAILFLLCALLALNFFKNLPALRDLGIIIFCIVYSIQIIPLLLFLPGLYHTRLRSYAWLSFVILLYFMRGVLTAFESTTRLIGLVEVLICTLLFCSIVIFIRRYRSHYKTSL
ncbi:MAG: hypothetical protein CMQ02_00475 [Gammaproteobacteria bacterium]|nr:hypothetical protein [Gammaproteobacteria bacterium]